MGRKAKVVIHHNEDDDDFAKSVKAELGTMLKEEGHEVEETGPTSGPTSFTFSGSDTEALKKGAAALRKAGREETGATARVKAIRSNLQKIRTAKDSTQHDINLDPLPECTVEEVVSYATVFTGKSWRTRVSQKDSKKIANAADDSPKQRRLAEECVIKRLRPASQHISRAQLNAHLDQDVELILNTMLAG